MDSAVLLGRVGGKVNVDDYEYVNVQAWRNVF